MSNAPALPPGSLLPELARAVAARGGRLLVVGGWVRDQLRGERSKDLDAEIFGLAPEDVDAVLGPFDSIGRVGQHFPIWRLRHQPLDIGFPRDAALEYDPARPESLEAAFRAAARHRDLTLNAIAWDPIDRRCLDPWNGIRDIEARLLRAVDSETFGQDPVRGLRVARLHARLEAEVEPRTVELCRSLDLSSTPVERIAAELRGILIQPARPSMALHFLDRTDLIEIFPPIARMRDVPQDPRWHPEGDVFVHTCMVVDTAHDLAQELDSEAAEILQWAALCHDLGKPATTEVDGERVRSHGHETLGARQSREWLEQLRVAHQITSAVEVLVAHHLAPSQLTDQGAGPRAYRRLARKLASGGVTARDLERLARADHLGRTTEEAVAGTFPAGARFLAAAQAAGVEQGVRVDLVTARHLMSHGIRPGPVLGRALDRARQIQDETGWDDPERLVRSVLDELGIAGDGSGGSDARDEPSN